jgi:beta-glucosidase
MHRREFVAAAGLGSAAAMLSSAAVPAPKTAATPAPAVGRFPSKFWWGVATASYQVEGAASADGRKPSVWDTFSHTSGRTHGGDTGDVACDHYHRFEEDVRLMADLGVKHYRFSIAWPRIIPDGRGKVNEQGVDFYRRLVEALLKHDITPHATLFHWDSPQALEDRYGSWRSREMAKDFAAYATETVRRLGDRIHYWMTINEITCFTNLGYGVGAVPMHAPGTVVRTRKEVQQTVHHALLAHGLACQAIRAESRLPPHVSLVENLDSYVPVAETPEHIAAVRKAFVREERNGTMIVAALTGKHDPHAWARLGADAPDVRPGDMETIAQPLNALGVNLYSGAYVRAADNKQGYEVLPMRPSFPKADMPWLNITPEAMYWTVRMVGEAIGRRELPVYISENGCASEDEVSPGGEVFDPERIMFLRAYLGQLQRAVAEGYPVKGYFLWSLLDNFEWSCGYSKRFGITHVDFKTQRRIPKLSYRWYQETIRAGRVM